MLPVDAWCPALPTLFEDTIHDYYVEVPTWYTLAVLHSFCFYLLCIKWPSPHESMPLYLPTTRSKRENFLLWLLTFSFLVVFHHRLYMHQAQHIIIRVKNITTCRASLVLQKLNGQDRLSEVSHSVDGGVFQALLGFVLSMCYSIDTTHGHAIVSKFLSWSVDAGFVLLPLHHWDLELDSVGVSTIMLLFR